MNLGMGKELIRGKINFQNLSNKKEEEKFLIWIIVF